VREGGAFAGVLPSIAQGFRVVRPAHQARTCDSRSKGRERTQHAPRRTPGVRPVTDFLAYLALGTQAMLVVTVVLFTLSGVDDLVIDVYYFFRQLWVLLYVRPRWPRLREEQLLGAVEQPIAIVVPAWQESPVIGKMIDNTVRTLRYSKYRIFVGTYPNDPDTQLEVERARERYENVERIVCPKDGPTNKADCLNWIIQGIRHHEHQTGTRFAIFVMHDAEDIVHPLSLKLFNYLMPRFAMIQIPVFSLPRHWWEFTAGVYMDEFAELHGKDILVRESIAGQVPSAGVGTCFSRRAVLALLADGDGVAFDVQSLTEDYDIGLRLRAKGMKEIFVRFPVVKDAALTGRPVMARGCPWENLHCAAYF